MDTEVKVDTNVEKVIADLLAQNAQLRLEVAVLRATIEHEKEIESKMAMSRSFPPEAVEMLSKLDIK